MASLQPVYKQLNEAEDEVELQEIGLVSVEQDVPASAPSKESCGDEKEKWCKKRSFARRLCGCVCGFLLFGTLLWLIAGLAVGSYVAVRSYRCLNPRYSHTTEYKFTDDEVKEFDLGVVSGVINVRTCPHIEKMTLFVVNKAARPDLLEVMPTVKRFTEGVFSINVFGPSIDFQNCQHTEMTLVIPDRLAAKHKLSLKAQAIVGKISIEAPQHTFNTLSVYTNVGLIKAEDVKTTGTFEAEARVGFLRVRGVDAQSTSLRTNVGKVCAGNVKSAVETEVFVETGRAFLTHFEAPVVTMTSEIGWISAVDFANIKTVTGRVDFGKLSYVARKDWNGQFTLQSPYGFIDVAHDKNVQSPKFTANTPAIMTGSFGAQDNKAQTEAPQQLNLQASFASVNLYVPH